MSDAVHAVFGTHQFDVMNVKILMNEIGSNPQIPHADDHCNRELFGVAHIQDEQPATECIPYDAQAPYPTGLQVECEACKKWRALPDVWARRREHAVGGRFTCAAAGRACGDADDDVDAIDPFANDLATSFHQLLFDPKAVLEAMRPAGAPPKAGDGLIALQTLVHRGPGNNNCPFERKVLFFSLRPVFSDARDAVKDIGTYDPASQIHAGWLLWRAAEAVPDAEEVISNYDELGFQLTNFGKGTKVRWVDYDQRGKKDKKMKKRAWSPTNYEAAPNGAADADADADADDVKAEPRAPTKASAAAASPSANGKRKRGRPPKNQRTPKEPSAAGPSSPQYEGGDYHDLSSDGDGDGGGGENGGGGDERWDAAVNPEDMDPATLEALAGGAASRSEARAIAAALAASRGLPPPGAKKKAKEAKAGGGKEGGGKDGGGKDGRLGKPLEAAAAAAVAKPKKPKKQANPGWSRAPVRHVGKALTEEAKAERDVRHVIDKMITRVESYETRQDRQASKEVGHVVERLVTHLEKSEAADAKHLEKEVGKVVAKLVSRVDAQAKKIAEGEAKKAAQHKAMAARQGVLSGPGLPRAAPSAAKANGNGGANGQNGGAHVDVMVTPPVGIVAGQVVRITHLGAQFDVVVPEGTKPGQAFPACLPVKKS